MSRKPFIFYILIILLLSISGAILLMLPGINLQPGFSFTDALFTSVSALTLTGLEVTGTGTSFSVAGQIIILILIQTGGLLYVISTLYFAYLLKLNLAILPDPNEEISSKKALQIISLRVITIAAVLEIAAVFAIFSLLAKSMETVGFGTKLFYSVFHAVSAFCNSGFTLYKDGFSNSALNDLYILHLALAAFMLLGALGFPAIYDLTSIKKLRERMTDPGKNWELNTRISIYAAFILTITGAILFYFLEHKNSLLSQKTVESGISSLFHSISARSTGFSTINIADFSQALLWFIVLFMFIGGSSASMAGGIKVQTFYFLFFKTNGFSQNQPKHQVLRVLLKALFLSIILVLVVSYALYLDIDNRSNYFLCLFETVSAFGNSGFSVGITKLSSAFGKLILILTMLSGRIIFPGLIFRMLIQKTI